MRTAQLPIKGKVRFAPSTGHGMQFRFKKRVGQLMDSKDFLFRKKKNTTKEVGNLPLSRLEIKINSFYVAIQRSFEVSNWLSTVASIDFLYVLADVLADVLSSAWNTAPWIKLMGKPI